MLEAKVIEMGKVGWRPEEWGKAVGLSRAMVYVLISEGKLRTVKHGNGPQRARIILTQPLEYLEQIEREQAL